MILFFIDGTTFEFKGTILIRQKGAEEYNRPYLNAPALKWPQRKRGEMG